MLDPKEMQKRVRENFKNIMDTHAKAGLPVSYSEGDKTLNYYKDGRVIDVTYKYNKKDKEDIRCL
jgi:hypothetical protein